MQICEEENYPQNFQLNSAKYANIANYRHIIQNNILHFHHFYKTPDTRIWQHRKLSTKPT